VHTGYRLVRLNAWKTPDNIYSGQLDASQGAFLPLPAARCRQAFFAALADSVSVFGIFSLSVFLQEHRCPFPFATLRAFQIFLARGMGAEKVGEH
jgi:hypothetical protein